MTTEMTEGRDPNTGQFVKGFRGGPGRQKGSRNKLGEAFIADVYESWQKHGRETLEQMRRDDPAAYVRLVANILPDRLDVGIAHQFARIERVIVQVPERVIEHDDTLPERVIEHDDTSRKE
jgi:hypothetical protein